MHSLCEIFYPFAFVAYAAAVVDDSGNLAAIWIQVFDSAENVIGGINCHRFSAGYKKNGIGILSADRNGKAAADNITKHIIYDLVIMLHGVELVEKIKSGQDSASGTTHSRSGPSCFHAASVQKSCH